MKPSTVSLSLAAAASAALVGALTTGVPCDLSAIQSALLANATTGLEHCASISGVDIFALTDFPTEEQAQAVFQDRDCVDYLNQVNQRANAQIQCDLTVGNTTVNFADLIVEFLSGLTGEPEASASDSGSSEASSASDSGSSDASSASDSGSSEASSEASSDASSEASSVASSEASSKSSDASVGDDSASKSAASSGGSAVAAASLAVAAAAVLAGSLGL